jgi:hypothetical protein
MAESWPAKAPQVDLQSLKLYFKELDPEGRIELCTLYKKIERSSNVRLADFDVG